MKKQTISSDNGESSCNTRYKRQVARGFYWRPALIFFLAGFFISCASSSLLKARADYLQAQKLERSLRQEEATAFYKKTREEVSATINRKPTAEAYLLKGLAEVNLNLWEEAENSFRLAADLGEDKALAWAEELRLYGLARSFEAQGWTETSGRLYEILADKGKYLPVVRAAVGQLVDLKLKAFSEMEKNSSPSQKERDKILADAIKIVEQAVESEPAYGYYHYLLAQVLAHQKDYGESLEEAVMAKELGLPSEKINRDNDLQIVFCYEQLGKILSGEELTVFQLRYNNWVKKWKWVNTTTPDWKRS
jgi:tetratricopeptide (TPR) repeat protein